MLAEEADQTPTMDPMLKYLRKSKLQQHTVTQELAKGLCTATEELLALRQQNAVPATVTDLYWDMLAWPAILPCAAKVCGSLLVFCMYGDVREVPAAKVWSAIVRASGHCW